MKKIIRKGLIIIMSISTTLSMGACLPVNKNTASEVCEALRTKYGEEFIATHIGDRLETSTTKIYAYPKNNRDIVFTAKIDQSGNVTDDYVVNLLMDGLEKNIINNLKNEGLDCDVTATVVESEIFETDKNIDINDFAKKNSIESILACVIFDGQKIDAQSVLAALERSSNQYDFKLVICGYSFDHEAFLECEKDFNSFPFVGVTQIESYEPVCSFKLSITNGRSSISEDELLNILED